MHFNANRLLQQTVHQIMALLALHHRTFPREDTNISSMANELQINRCVLKQIFHIFQVK